MILKILNHIFHKLIQGHFYKKEYKKITRSRIATRFQKNTSTPILFKRCINKTMRYTRIINMAKKNKNKKTQLNINTKHTRCLKILYFPHNSTYF